MVDLCSRKSGKIRDRSRRSARNGTLLPLPLPVSSICRDFLFRGNERHETTASSFLSSRFSMFQPEDILIFYVSFHFYLIFLF